MGPAGHDVLIGGRTPQKSAELAKRIGAQAAAARGSRVRRGDLAGGAAEGLVETLELAGAPEGTLAGKTVIDCGNAVNVADFSLVTWEGRSLAEQAQHLAPGSHVVKAFNQAHARVWQMTPPSVDGRPLAVPYAGDDEGKKIARTLITDLGAEPLDAGDLSQARHLEAMAIVIIRLLFSGYDPHSAFAFVSPGKTGPAVSSR